MAWGLLGLGTTWPGYEIRDKGYWVVALNLPSSSLEDGQFLPHL